MPSSQYELFEKPEDDSDTSQENGGSAKAERAAAEPKGGATLSANEIAKLLDEALALIRRKKEDIVTARRRQEEGEGNGTAAGGQTGSDTEAALASLSEAVVLQDQLISAFEDLLSNREESQEAIRKHQKYADLLEGTYRRLFKVNDQI